MPSSGGGRLRPRTEVACEVSRLSLSSTRSALASMVGGSSLANGVGAALRDAAGPWVRFAAEHALQERGGLDQLARTREAGLLRELWFDPASFHLILSARAALTAEVACKAPSTETEAMVARANSGVTSWAMVARPRTLMCSISPARRAASRSSRV